MLSFSRSIATIDLQPIVNPIASDWGFVYQCATLIPIRDWDQLDIGISPIVPLGSVPMSDWDQSQLDIGIDPNV